MKNTFFKLSQTAFTVGCSALCALVSATALANSDQPLFNANNPMDRIQVGNLVVYSLTDSPQIFSKTLFQGIDQMPERLALMPDGKFPGVVKTFFVQIDSHNILFDAGWGKSSGRNGNTTALLSKLGISNVDVTDILLTHMDGDHISGLLHGEQAAYPKATLWIARKEFEAWMQGSERKTQKNELAQRVVKTYENKIALFDYDTEIIKGITAKAAIGHTPGHTRYDIDSNGVGMSIVGDLMHVTPIQMRWTDYSNAYDGNPHQAAETRESVLKEISESKRILGGMHFENVGRILRSSDGGYVFEK